MKLALLLLAAGAAVAAADSTAFQFNATKDATVSYNHFTFDNGTQEAYTAKGNDPTLVAMRSAVDYRRILLGFTLPKQVDKPAQIAKCMLNVPRPIRAPGQTYTLLAYSAAGAWDESTVTAATELTTVKELGSTNVTLGSAPGAIDILDACQTASNGQFSVFVDSSRPLVAFNARDTGRDIFSVDLTY
ncbi:hypothetical protein H4R19_002231 [Coemansia spiralis]|nr:hypothetical protein H4R19_002231 [Coemansia spiralis]